MEQNCPHVLTVENRKGVFATGVIEVIFFNDREIRLNIADCKLVISGENLKISGFNKQSGEFKATGTVFGTKYINSTNLSVKKFFK